MQLIERYKELEQLKPEVEFFLTIVDDGSRTDQELDTTMIKKAISNFSYHKLKSNKGKGAALRKGVKATETEFIIYTDHDFPYAGASMAKVMDALINPDIEVVIGIRPTSYYQAIPAKRKLVSKVLQLLNRIFLNLPTNDTQAGLKGFTRSVKDRFLDTKIEGFLFDLEFLKLIKKRRLPTRLVEINLRENISLSELKIKSLSKELWIYLKLLLS